MKPLDVVDEEDGPWAAPLAALNHLFPIHWLRARPSWIPRAGHGERFPSAGETIWSWVRAAIDDDRGALESALSRFGELEQALLGKRWWRGIGAFLAARAQSLDVLEAVPTAHRPALVAHGLAARQRHAAILPAVVTLVRWLQDAGIEVVVVKGLAHAVPWYPEAWSRAVGDVDLVVAPADEPAARAELERRGAVSTVARHSQAFVDHHHGAPLRLDVDGHPLVCELHTSLGPDDRSGELARRALSERCAVETDAGSLPVPGAALRLAHAALHHTAELDAKGLLDLLLAARSEELATWRAARDLLPESVRWRLDLAGGLAAHTGERPELIQALPAARHAAIERGVVADWGCAQAAYMCRAGGRPRPRHWLAPWRLRVEEVVEHPARGAFHRRQLAGASAWVSRQVRLVGRLLGDTWTFLFPPAANVTGSYVMNSARALKSLAVRACAPLRRARS